MLLSNALDGCPKSFLEKWLELQCSFVVRVLEICRRTQQVHHSVRRFEQIHPPHRSFNRVSMRSLSWQTGRRTEKCAPIAALRADGAWLYHREAGVWKHVYFLRSKWLWFLRTTLLNLQGNVNDRVDPPHNTASHGLNDNLTRHMWQKHRAVGNGLASPLW